MAKSTEKKYAATGNPTINAILKSLYRFATLDQARERVAQLKSHFVTAKQLAEELPPEEALLWIRGYALTPEETTAGFTGNYAHITCSIEGGHYTLRATKHDAELKTHPQRKRPTQKHPDWGHPILRDIKKKRVFPTIEAASDELQRLHVQFPDISIPDEARLMIIVYEKLPEVKSPVQKYKFEIKSVPEGGFFIDFKRNTKAQKLPGTATAAKAQENQGHFTSMVMLKRRKKKPKPTA